MAKSDYVYSPRPAHYLYSRLTNYDIDTINDYRDHVDLQYQKSKIDLKNKINSIKDDSEKEFARTCANDFVDEYFILDEIKTLSNQLSIIALYRVVELKTRMVLKCFYKDNEKNKIDLLSMEDVSSKLNKDFGIDIKQLQSFIHIDELRHLNNAIKHQNKVTSKLAKFNGWTEGEDINGLSKIFERLSPEVPKYVADLTRRLFETKSLTSHCSERVPQDTFTDDR